MKARVFVQVCIGWGGDLRGIDRFLVMGFAGEGRPEIEHFGRHFVAEENVLSGMGLLLPARGLRVPLGVGGTLPAALRPVKHGEK